MRLDIGSPDNLASNVNSRRHQLANRAETRPRQAIVWLAQVDPRGDFTNRSTNFERFLAVGLCRDTLFFRVQLDELFKAVRVFEIDVGEHRVDQRAEAERDQLKPAGPRRPPIVQTSRRVAV